MRYPCCKCCDTKPEDEGPNAPPLRVVARCNFAGTAVALYHAEPCETHQKEPGRVVLE